MIRYKTYLIIVFALLLSFYSQAQNLFTQHIDIEEGLPSNKVYDIYKDSRGLYWFATGAGLVKYNGSQYTTYTKEDGLAGNAVWSVTEDDKNNLWLACYGAGISCFNGKTFTNYTIANGLVNNNVRKIQYSQKFKGLLIGTVKGFSFFKDSSFVNFSDSLKLMQVTSWLESDSLVYLFTYKSNKQYIKFYPVQGKFSYLKNNHRFHYHTPYTTLAYITNNKDTIIGDDRHGIKRYTKDSIVVNYQVGQVFDIKEDNAENYWLASWNDNHIETNDDKGGIYKISNGSTRHMNNLMGIASEQCWKIFQAVDSSFFIFSTLDKGMYKLNNLHISYTSAINFNTHKPVINDIYIDSANILRLTVGNNLYSISNDTIVYKESQFIAAYNRYKKKYNFNFISHNLSRFELYKISEDKTGNIWLSSNIGAFNIDKDQNISYVLAESMPFEIIHDSDSTISNLCQFQLFKRSKFTGEIYSEELLRKNPSYASITKYIKQGKNIYLYNNTDGILSYSPDSIKYHYYLQSEIDLNFEALCTDNAGYLYAGTGTGKIYKLKNVGDSIRYIKEYKFEKRNYGYQIRWLISDNKNRIWAGTNKGMLLFENDSLTRFFNDETGFPCKKTNKAVLDSNGILKVISNDRLIQFNPDKLISHKHTPVLDLYKININYANTLWEENQSSTWKNLPSNPITLTYKENTLVFYFTLKHLLSPTQNQFSYRLKGSQNKWSPYSSRGEAVFNNLSPGKYEFQLRARLISNPQEITSIIYSFKIAPPWYKSKLFYVAILLFIMGVIYFIYSIRIHTIKKKALVDQRLAELKMEALQAQMNPHFIFNSFSSLQYSVLNQDINSALAYIADFAKLMRSTLDNSTEKLISITQEITYLKQYLKIEKFRYEKMEYSIELDEMLNAENTFLPPMLLQPLIENSLLHGIRHSDNTGLLTIKFEYLNKTTLCISIADNGIGRGNSEKIYKEKGKTHKSHASRIINERIHLLKKDPLWSTLKLNYFDLFNGNKPAGTVAKLTLPIRVERKENRVKRIEQE